MSFSPKHTTAFSVTDILSPIEENYKRTSIEAVIPPLVSPGVGSTGSQQAPYPGQYNPGGIAVGLRGSSGTSGYPSLQHQHQFPSQASTPSPHEAAATAAAAAAAAAMNGSAMTSPYHNYMAGQLGAHHTSSAFPASQYCNGSDLSHYGAHDPMAQARGTTAGWYAATNPDPRIASECNSTTLPRGLFQEFKSPSNPLFPSSSQAWLTL